MLVADFQGFFYNKLIEKPKENKIGIVQLTNH
jgi:hypothetical protein